MVVPSAVGTVISRFVFQQMRWLTLAQAVLLMVVSLVVLFMWGSRAGSDAGRSCVSHQALFPDEGAWLEGLADVTKAARSAGYGGSFRI
jgi:hypothetical protein